MLYFISKTKIRKDVKMKKFLTLTLLATFFASGVLYADVVFDCNKCEGSGRVKICRTIRCRSCNGVRGRCPHCNGRGQTQTAPPRGPFDMPSMSRPCMACLGDGKASCSTCYDSGKEYLSGTATCPQCNGHGKFTL